EWDGANWNLAAAQAPPGPRMRQAMAFDRSRGVTVLLSGNCTTSGTWEWNGAQWRLADDNTSPLARIGTAMAFDFANAGVLLFGGQGGVINIPNFRNFPDTWLWNGRRWTRLAPTNSPPGRELHALASDVARSRIVLFGGANYVFPNWLPLNDTWEWDGTNWQLMTPSGASPSARFGHVMTFDTAR